MGMETLTLSNRNVAYKIFGKGKVNLVIETGLAASVGEWFHIAEKLTPDYTVLLYERSKASDKKRTPKNIAEELHEIIEALPHEEKIIIVAHSQGGLYAQQFARLYPEHVKGLVLLDPLSANDSRYKVLLNEDEQKMSGFDKSKALNKAYRMTKLHLNFILKAVLKKVPPFYYYDKFTQEAANYILSQTSSADFYAAAIEEYKLAHDEKETAGLKNKDGFPNVPLVLITHSSNYEIKEIEEFGSAPKETAEKIENIWQSLMSEYLTFSTLNRHYKAKFSGHYIHLTEPDLIDKALLYIEKFPI